MVEQRARGLTRARFESTLVCLWPSPRGSLILTVWISADCIPRRARAQITRAIRLAILVHILFERSNLAISKVRVEIRGILLNPAAMVFLVLGGLFALPSVFPGAGVAYAQNTNATIRGQVLDSTGALVPNAQVVILNKNTGVTVFNGKTDSAGAFVAPQVIPGTYKITVSASGLRDAVIDNLVATVPTQASTAAHITV